MVIARGDVVWADFGAPRGSEPAKRRPTVVIQEAWLNESDLATILVVPLTSNRGLEAFPGNVLVPAAAANLDVDSVALVMQLGPVSRAFLDPYPVGQLPGYLMTQLAAGVRLVTGI